MKRKDGFKRPTYGSIFSEIDIEFWGTIYNRIFILNKKTKDYVDYEISKIISGKKVLGVVVRGTDYTKLKPKGHGKRPEVSDILEQVKKVSNKFDAIYLATEEKKVDDLFRSVFPGKILTNKRKYYDEIFENNRCDLIGQVHFDRENDDYYKGLEYLSSIWILSKCNGLIAGVCGASRTALYINKNNYDYKYIFDLGTY